MTRLLAALVFAQFTASAVRAQPPANPLTAPEVQAAAVWHTASLRLRAELGEIGESALPGALAAAGAEWRARPPSLVAEVPQVVERGRRWVAMIRASLGAAAWPTDRPPAAYARVAEQELAGALTELEIAGTTGESPDHALIRVTRVRDWTRGQRGRPTSFDNLEAEAVTALVAALAPHPGGDPPTVPPPTGTGQRIALRWLGEGPDAVGPRGASPDGRPDAYLELRFEGGARLVSMINLSFRDSSGQLCCHAWSTGDSRFDYLGTGSPGGQIMNRPAWHPAGLGYPPAVLTLVAPGVEWFRAGRIAVATIVYADGSFESADMPPPR